MITRANLSINQVESRWRCTRGIGEGDGEVRGVAFGKGEERRLDFGIEVADAEEPGVSAGAEVSQPIIRGLKSSLLTQPNLSLSPFGYPSFHSLVSPFLDLNFERHIRRKFSRGFVNRSRCVDQKQ